jgi:hypothetical protein
MRDVLFTPGPSRVKGRPALVKRLRRLALAVERYGRHRATSRDDLLWAGTVLAGLLAALADADAHARATDE